MIGETKSVHWVSYADHESALSAANAEIEKYKTIMMAAAVEIREHWEAHCDADGYGPSNLLMRLENGLHGGGYAYTAEDWIKCRERIAELSKLKEELVDAAVAVSDAHKERFRAQGELAALRTAIREATEKWQRQQNEYFDTGEGVYAAVAVRCCVAELLEIIGERLQEPTDKIDPEPPHE